MNMTFCEKIKYLRENRGMTFQQVADIVGVGKSTVRKWETGDIKNLKRDKIQLLAEALGVNPGYLMGWNEEEPQNEIVLTDKERRLISAYRRAIPVIQDAALQMLESNALAEKERRA